MAVLEKILSRMSVLAGGRNAGDGAVLKTITRLALGGNKSIAVLEFEGMRFLVGCGADTVSCIHAMPAVAPAACVVRK
jgi:flagellar biogenesis protein FliO